MQFASLHHLDAGVENVSHCFPEWLSRITAIDKHILHFGEQNAHGAAAAGAALKRHAEINDLKLVLVERPCRLSVLAAPCGSI
jgi:hypothetical protein